MVGSSQKLIENMKVAFSFAQRNNARFFQQKIGYSSSDRFAASPKYYFHVLSKSARIPIAKRSGISKRFEQRIGLDDHVFDVLLIKKINQKPVISETVAIKLRFKQDIWIPTKTQIGIIFHLFRSFAWFVDGTFRLMIYQNVAKDIGNILVYHFSLKELAINHAKHAPIWIL